MSPQVDNERCFVVGDKVINLDGKAGVIVETILIDGLYPMHALQYPDGVGIPIWENHELRPYSE